MCQDSAAVGVVIPVRNEAASIALVLQDIPADINALVVVVDNGSTDATAHIAQESGAVVLHEQIPGYGRVMSKGIGYFKGLFHANQCMVPDVRRGIVHQVPAPQIPSEHTRWIARECLRIRQFLRVEPSPESGHRISESGHA